ncbi:MAG TPA: hypothetical protein VGG83_20515 [Trebonia sp.]
MSKRPVSKKRVRKTVTVAGVPVTVTVGHSVNVTVGPFDPQAAAGRRAPGRYSGTVLVAVHAGGETWLADLYPAPPAPGAHGEAPPGPAGPAVRKAPR